jgi:rhamnosyltransferase subunit B
VHIVLTPVGSSGDVNPFVAVGRALRARGHDVTMIAPGPFAEVAARAGLRFVSGWAADEFDRATKDPDLWHPQRGLRLILRTAAAQMRAHYAAIASVYEPGRRIDGPSLRDPQG